jgi:hypothetical protein
MSAHQPTTRKRGWLSRVVFGDLPPPKPTYRKSRDYVAACLPCVTDFRLGVLTCELCGGDTVIIPKESFL